jgi:hypothetical protein
LLKLHDELTQTNPSAVARLAEGLEHTLTVLDLDRRLRSSLSKTNSIVQLLGRKTNLQTGETLAGQRPPTSLG